MIDRQTASLPMEERIRAACSDAAQAAIDRARRTDTRIVISRDGEVVYLTPAEAQEELNRKREECPGNSSPSD